MLMQSLREASPSFKLGRSDSTVAVGDLIEMLDDWEWLRLRAMSDLLRKLIGKCTG